MGNSTPGLIYYLYRLGGGVAPRLAPRLGYPLFGAVGELAHALNRTGRDAARSNIRHILGPDAPQAQVNRLARAAFSTVAYNTHDLFRLPTLTAAQLDRMVEVQGWENVVTALSLGKGIVIASAHFGNAEMVVAALLGRGLSITIPAERIRDRKSVV